MHINIFNEQINYTIYIIEKGLGLSVAKTRRALSFPLSDRVTSQLNGLALRQIRRKCIIKPTPT